jgi:hypothetical protein
LRSSQHECARGEGAIDGNSATRRTTTTRRHDSEAPKEDLRLMTEHNDFVAQLMTPVLRLVAEPCTALCPGGGHTTRCILSRLLADGWDASYDDVEEALEQLAAQALVHDVDPHVSNN